ncbi:FecR domain-containing protein [Sphingobacterium sp.]|uniref:FecR family protein n=1 Tax=Sphingobacterium sp. TaxID=341027 RepID=UPI0028A25D7C|nr:FecR domain-containing protein [Sphingobacterium sp.]
MREEKAKQLLQKYLHGEANATEIKQVEEWYGGLDRDRDKISQERKNALRDKMLGNIQSAISEKASKRHSGLNSYLFKIAAAVLMITSIGLLYWKLDNQPIAPSSQIVTTTLAGEHKKIILADGSEIIMEPSSKISYPSKFEGKIRKIVLTEGEAFFTIAHDEQHPFQVQLDADLAVKVLGTSFRIKAYQASQNVEVLVATGKVAVQQKEKTLGVLTKNQSLLYSKQTQQSSRIAAKKNTSVAITFQGSSLHEVTQQLAYVYNIKIILNDKTLIPLKTTATFNSTQNPEEILDILCRLHHIRYSTIEKNTVFKIHK